MSDSQPPPAPGSDSATGTSDTGCLRPDESPCGFRLTLYAGARSGAAGENPAGALSLVEAGPSPGGSTSSAMAVTCLSVNDRVAIIGVTGSRQRFGAGAPRTQLAGLVRIVDGGGADSLAPGPTSCSSFPGPFPFPSLFNNPSSDFRNQTGDLVVTDTRQLPTSKAQCKKGGWKTYNAFQTQGDCVSFVATKGKTPPGKKKP
jgi:hypothetical protein